MTPITITLTDEPTQARASEPLTFGVPLPKGALTTPDQLSLTQANSADPWPLQAEATAHWPDGSIRWLLVHTQVPTQLQSRSTELTLQQRTDREPPKNPSLQLTETDTEWQVQAAGYEHRINKGTGTLYSRATGTQPSSAEPWQLSAQLAPANHNAAEPLIDQCTMQHTGPVSQQLQLKGHWPLPEQPRFTLTLTFYAQGGLVAADYCLHNPNRARHPGGLWDLGDSGSFYFTELSLNIRSAEPLQGRLQAEPDHAPINGPARLYQDSSGGEHWNSQNHIDKDGQLTTQFRGYRLHTATGDDSGLRAQPSLEAAQGEARLTLASPRFWQNFPASLVLADQSTGIGLFPAESGQTYELQGGERKTHRLYLAFGQPLEALSWVANPIVPRVSAQAYESAQAFPWFSANAEPGPLDELIRIGLEGEQNFFAKREIIDEYGWRNFGDIFADHETLYQPEGEAPLVSHYNNQYDAIYGFARQFALTGDSRWYELMNDLAHHVTDIDIYHTNEDRAEYNHGLFWHTDHYLPVQTATHRSFSRLNETSSTPGQTGGGPAEEHCYTTGLLYHYFITGNLDSKAAVINLTEWLIVQREGENCLLSQINKFKKRELPRLLNAIKSPKPYFHSYAFTRGTGNYLNSLLDSYILTMETRYIQLAERVIRLSVSVRDDVGSRNLHHIESNWSYTIFLSSLVRYIHIKDSLGSKDKSFHYAIDALGLYVRWIFENERPYREFSEQLEYPNDTWTAQEIRKAFILNNCLRYVRTVSQENLCAATDYWLSIAVDGLKMSLEKDLSRIQIILLQNNSDFTEFNKDTIFTSDKGVIQSVSDSSYFSSWLGLFIALKEAGRRVLLGLASFGIKKELEWIKRRKEVKK